MSDLNLQAALSNIDISADWIGLREVKETTSGKDVERAKNVWDRRTQPRVRKPPTPTRRQKDGE